MAEENTTQSGIRVGGWLPAVPVEPAATPRPPAGPRRLAGDPGSGAREPAEPAGANVSPADDAAPAPSEVAVPPGDAAGPVHAVHAGPTPVDRGPGGSTIVRPASVGPASVGPASVRPAPGPAPLIGHAPPPNRAVSREGVGRRSAGVDPFGDGRSAVAGRHTAPESLRTRLAGLAGPFAVRLRGTSVRLRRASSARLLHDLRAVAARPAPEDAATRVGAARARRRRRRTVLATAVLTASVVALAYSARSPAPPERGRTVPAAGPATPTPAPTAAPPTVVPATGDPALPGDPLLGVDQEPVPPTVSLTLLGTRDWRHWGGAGADSVQRKQRGTGEIEDPGGGRLEHNAGVSGLSWTDGTPTARQEGTRTGVFRRGAGKTFTLGVAGSGDLRTVRLFVGVFSAGARLDVSLSGGGDPAVREVALAQGDRFYQYVVHFRAPRGQRLSITWRALAVTGGQNDGVSLEAITVS
ncbi:hypothetical protein ACH495_18190 [Micromonospora sp. NPDC018662]|uniref:hypothetical protein n=1 Tax=Micromonospora sp. NPDC018662 TaxID=3364238 RepID=UPI0037971733